MIKSLEVLSVLTPQAGSVPKSGRKALSKKSVQIYFDNNNLSTTLGKTNSFSKVSLIISYVEDHVIVGDVAR